MTKKLLFFLIVAALAVACLSSCSLFATQNNVFEGGQMLNDEMMSEIRANVLGTQQESDSATAPFEAKTENIPSESEIETAFEDETGATNTDAKEQTSAEEVSTEAFQTEEVPSVLYWTEGGEVWHTSPDCRYLKNKTVLSGTQADALEAGKKRLCSSCAK